MSLYHQDENQGLEGPRSRSAGPQRSDTSLQAVWPGQLVEMVRISPKKSREAKMRCVKLLGEGIRPGTSTGRTEVQIHIVRMNRFTSLGTPDTVRMR